MPRWILSPLRKVVRWTGYDIVRYRNGLPPLDAPAGQREPLDPTEERILDAVAPYTMTNRERLLAVIDAARYVVRSRVPGAIVECGVWRGGSSMAAALTLLSLGDRGRDLYLFDTFEGMPPPTDHDRDVTGATAAQLLEATPKNTGVWCYAGIDDVRANIRRTDYPSERVHLIRGKVEDTIPHAGLGQIALLRLDTDWYESTKHELTHLYPLLAPGGVLIIDDYGYWQGARRAVDEYFAGAGRDPLLMSRIDFTGRIAVKPRAAPTP